MNSQQQQQLAKIAHTLMNKSLMIRNKVKLNIEQFLSIFKQYQEFRRKYHKHPISNINDRGIFITLLAQMLYKGYLAYQIRVKGLTVQFEFKETKKRQKRVKNNDDDSSSDQQGRKRRKVRKNRRKRGEALKNIGNDIQDLSNDSLTNPSNVERPRIMTETKEDSSNPANSNRQKPDQNSQGSKQSGQNNNDKLKLELNKITQQIRGLEDTYVGGMQDFQGINIQQNSQSQSNSNSGFQSHQITDLNQKLQILTETKRSNHQSTRKKTGNKRNTNKSAYATTKKKMISLHSQILDEKLEDPTGYDMTEMTMMNTANMSHLSDLRVSMFDGDDSSIMKDDKQRLLRDNEVQNQYDEFRQDYMHELFPQNKKQQNSRHSNFVTVNSEPINMLSLMNEHVEQVKNFFDSHNLGAQVKDQYQPDMMMRASQEDGYIDIGYPDYTMSQPITGPLQYQTNQLLSIEQTDEDLKDALSRKNKVSLTSLAQQNANKDVSILFYRLLWKFQQGGIDLIQENNENFGEIFVKQN